MRGQNFFKIFVVVLLAVTFCGGCCSKNHILKTVHESKQFTTTGEFSVHIEKAVPVLENLTKRVKTAEGNIEKNSNSISRLEGYTGIPEAYPDCNIPTLTERLDALASNITAYQNRNATILNGFETRVQTLEKKPAPESVIIRQDPWQAQYALATAEAVAKREQQIWEIQTEGYLKFVYFYGYEPTETEMPDDMRAEFRQQLNSHIDPNDASTPLFRNYYTPIQISGITSSDGSPEKNREINIARASDAIAQLKANGIDTDGLEPQFGGYKKDKRGFLIVWKKQ